MNQLRQFLNYVPQTRWGKTGSVILVMSSFIYLFFQTFGLDLSGNGFDFLLFIETAQRTSQGISPYTGIEESPYSSYLYPPVLAFLMIPLSWLPIHISGIVWFILNVAALFGSLWLLESLRNGLSPQRYYLRGLFPVFILIFILYIPLQNHLKNGQMNLMALFFLLLSLRQYILDKKITSALAMAFALSIKPLPIAVLLYFLVRRSWAVLSMTFILMALFLLLPYLTMGDALFSAYRQYFHTLFYVFPADNFPKGDYQIYTTVYDAVTYLIPVKTLAFRQIILIILCLCVLLMDAFWLSVKRREESLLLVWSLYLLLTLWIVPISEKHHLVLLLPALYVVGARALFQYTPTANVLGVGIFAFVGVFVAAKMLPDVPLYCALVLVLFVLVLIVFLTTNEDEETDPGAAL